MLADSIVFLGILCGGIKAHFTHDSTWTMGYILSFSVPLVVLPLLVWFVFVPRVLEYSDAQIRIVTIFRDTVQSWGHVKSYGSSTGIFTLRFKHEFQGYQIWSRAYPKADWNRFIDFLETRLPERES
jgi:hypothetical protein